MYDSDLNKNSVYPIAEIKIKGLGIELLYILKNGSNKMPPDENFTFY